jgi:hypothetical protein
MCLFFRTVGMTAGDVVNVGMGSQRDRRRRRD